MLCATARMRDSTKADAISPDANPRTGRRAHKTRTRICLFAATCAAPRPFLIDATGATRGEALTAVRGDAFGDAFS